MFKNVGAGNAWARAWAGIHLGLQTDAYNWRALKQQSKHTQSGIREQQPQSGRNQGAAVEFEADASGEQQLKWTQSGAAAEADANREQQLKRTQWRGAAAEYEADANGEQQLNLKWTQLVSSNSAQRAVRCRITHVGERWGSYLYL